MCIIVLAHSPDNSFMGFVIPNKYNASDMNTRKNQAVVYGKNDYMWKASLFFDNVNHKSKGEIYDVRHICKQMLMLASAV